ncbi:MAG: copper-binding protein [Burkholderiales bacterium]|nr:copper-binding protein [Burkholderiales bacterium]
MNRILILAVLSLPIPALAQKAADDHSAHHPAPAAAQAASAMSDGEVRRVDMDAKKITLRHGPIANLDMPPMTMVFQVKDPAMLNTVKTGDKVKFTAEKTGGAYVITLIESAR